MKKITTVFAVALFLVGNGTAWAEAGESTISIGYASVKADGVKKAVNGYRDAMETFVRDYNSVKPDGYTASGHVGSYNDLRGFNLKYRYEITDAWGVIASVSHASQEYKGRLNASKSVKPGSTSVTYAWPSSQADSSVKACYLAVMAGPTYRLNDYVSGYIMIGGASAKAEYHMSEQLNSSGESYHLNSNQNKTSLAYGVGLQFNPVKYITVDVAYEGSGSGDWKTSGFNVGLGYKF